MHATCVFFDGVGILFRGSSGSGKSDLALRLIDAGAWLVADDQTELERRGERLFARSPPNMAGRLEARGVGIVEVPNLAEVPLGLVVDLVAADGVERLPDERTCELCGVRLPLLALQPFEASIVPKLRHAIRRHAATLASNLPTPAEPAKPGPNQQWQPSSLVAAPATDACDVASPAQDGRMRVVMVTGLSGAGRSSALKALEDAGYEAIDNLPLSLVRSIVGEGSVARPVALGVDIRARNFAVDPFLAELDKLLSNPGLRVTLLFLDCETEVLRRRFTETRRRHPLAHERPVTDGIEAERRLLSPLRARADLVIDTSALTPVDLRRLVIGQLGIEQGTRMSVFVTSFSYRSGLPREADLVLDVRFLKNPHYEATLRPLTGRDAAVVRYVELDPGYPAFVAALTDMLSPLLPRYEREGKSYLTIAIGCTGGRHRSVVVAERLAAWLRAQGYQVSLGHRDIGRASETNSA